MAPSPFDTFQGLVHGWTGQSNVRELSNDMRRMQSDIDAYLNDSLRQQMSDRTGSGFYAAGSLFNMASLTTNPQVPTTTDIQEASRWAVHNRVTFGSTIGPIILWTIVSGFCSLMLTATFLRWFA